MTELTSIPLEAIQAELIRRGMVAITHADLETQMQGLINKAKREIIADARAEAAAAAKEVYDAGRIDRGNVIVADIAAALQPHAGVERLEILLSLVETIATIIQDSEHAESLAKAAQVALAQIIDNGTAH